MPEKQPTCNSAPGAGPPEEEREKETVPPWFTFAGRANENWTVVAEEPRKVMEFVPELPEHEVDVPALL